MYAYYLTRPIAVRTGVQRLERRAARQAGAPAADEVFVATPRELEIVRAALTQAHGVDALEGTLRLLTHEQMARFDRLPMRLGASWGDEDPDAEPLAQQLERVRAAHPGLAQFRVLLVNAFGSNLGDNLVGLTAFRQVLPVLRSVLPSVAVDVLFGLQRDDRLQRLYRGVEGIGTRLCQGPSIADLARYPAVFDQTRLTALPRYGRMPVVDWYLWWMGLDPATVPAAAKRNALALDPSVREAVAGLLAGRPGPRILVNPRASNALRSMPPEATRRLVGHLLDAWPQATVVLIQPPAFDHPRVLDLARAIDDVDRLAAVVALADALVGVDTATQHLADASSTPAVTLFTSVSPALYPYYPFGEAVVLPGAVQLPAWGRMKVPDVEWQAIAGRYDAAWQQLDGGAVVQALGRAMARRAAAPHDPGAPGPARIG